eukprot:1195837-Prorocentrum_minimum.AAC.3
MQETRVLVDIATKSLEPRQRDLMTQLLVDWAHKYAARPDVGGPFHIVRPPHFPSPPAEPTSTSKPLCTPLNTSKHL